MATPSCDSTTHRAAISRSSSTYARKRATKACQVCRARRTKCDQKRPSCSFCARAGVECVFEPDDNATFDQASLAIIDRLDRLERKIDAQALVGETRDNNPTNSNDIGLIKPSCPTLSREQLFPVTLGGVLKWPVFQDVTSPIATTNSPDSTRSHSRSANQQTAWLGDVLHRSSCDRWLDNFFAHVHVKNPILKETETRRLVSRLCMQGPDWDVASGLSLLVCANGAIARPLYEALPLSNPDVQAAITLFDAAQRRLGADLTSMGLIRAQCAFLSGVLLMSLLRPVEAWTTFVHGLAICQTFPFTRQGNDDSEDAAGTQEVSEQSVFWSCWKSERELRFELGMPGSSCLVDDPPQLFPNPPEGCQGDIERAWYFYLSEISLWRLEVNARRSIDQLQHGDYRGLLRALIEVYHDTLSQLEAWRSSLPPLVSIENGSTTEEDDVIRFVLRGRVTYVHELISWPFLYAVINDRNENGAADQQVTDALAFHYNRLLANTSGYYHRHHGTWLMVRSSARSACILLGFARLYPSSKVIPPAWKDAVLLTLKMVEYWSTEIKEMCPVLHTMTRLLEIVE